MKYRVTFLTAMALSLVLASGCADRTTMVVESYHDPVFPNGEMLQEGDVILGRSYGLIGAMFANYSQAGGKYSHGAMVYRDDRGRLMMLNYRPTGMETCTPEEFFTRYNRLALVRYAGDWNVTIPPSYTELPQGITGPEALSATARWWLWRNEKSRIPPDYRLDHDEHSAMFCLELTSTVYRDCGLPDPFYKARKASEDPLLTLGNQMFKTDVVEVRSPSSALDNEAFVRVAEWVRPDYDLREEALNEELMRIAIIDLEQGYRPKRPNVMGRLKLRQIFLLYHIVTKTMFWKPKQDLPDFIDNEMIENAYMLYSYVAKSKKLARERVRMETLPVFMIDENRELWLSAVRQIVRDSMDCHRDTYLQQSAQPFTSAVRYE